MVAPIGSLILLLDRLSKAWVLDNLSIGESFAPIPALYPFLRLFHAANSGVAFGMFKNGGMLFAIVAAIAVIAILIYSLRLGDESPIMWLSLGLMLGGASGNLWDRLVFDGSVIDFILVQFPGGWFFPTFNIADSGITVGTIALVLLMYLQDRRAAQANVEPA